MQYFIPNGSVLAFGVVEIKNHCFHLLLLVVVFADLVGGKLNLTSKQCA